MTLEKTLRKNVCDILRQAQLDPMAVENLCAVGCPDVNFIHGWIELKSTDKWPKKEDAPLKLKHDLSNEQRIWLRRRSGKGGNTWVLVQVGSAYLLMDGVYAAEHLGYVSRSELLANSYFAPSLSELRTELPQWLLQTTKPR